MKVAVLHYHYRPGGVTRVIENTLPHLRERHGVDVKIIRIPDLDYSNADFRIKNPENLIQEIHLQATQELGCQPDLWHIHNPTLGKHPAFPKFIEHLAGSNAPILMHIHDFAEDSRPSNYQLIRQNPSSEKLYPVSPKIHYGVLNQRDYKILQKAQIPEEYLHIIPNPVLPPQPLQESKSDWLKGKKLHFYPVRATQRKNLGELALLSMLAEKGHHFANSIGPTNPQQLESFQTWQWLAKDLELPIEFGICDHSDISFPEILASATSCVTTSMAEGFGLSFLEPALLGKPLWGRNLPEITQDFSALGIDLEHLYTDIRIPLSWLDMQVLKIKLRKKLEQIYHQYAKHYPEHVEELAWESMVGGEESLDFGILDQEDQIKVLRMLKQDAERKKDLPRIEELMSLGASEDSQRQIIQDAYSPENSARKLFEIYTKVLELPQEPICFLDPDKILSQFLHPRRFSFLLS
jgi:hypothetical protein